MRRETPTQKHEEKPKSRYAAPKLTKHGKLKSTANQVTTITYYY